MKPEKVEPTEEVLYLEKIQLVRVREVAPSSRKKTQELHETGFRYESSIIHVNRPSEAYVSNVYKSRLFTWMIKSQVWGHKSYI